MNDQSGAVGTSAHEQTVPVSVEAGATVDQVSNFTIAPFFGAPVTGKIGAVGATQPSDEAPAASLVGSLSVFTLSDVLSLLAATGQTGELQVVADTVDGRVWLDGGKLSNAHVGDASTMGQAVFELACAAEGWFYFTVGLTSSSGQPTVPVAAVLDEVRPQVEEWRDLQQVVPLDATVALSPSPPGQDVQIRADQWQVLTAVGTTGYSVRTVIDQITGDQIVGLRALRDLQAAGLIVLGPPPAPETDHLAESYLLATGASPSMTTQPSPSPVNLVEELGADTTPVPPVDRAVATETGFGRLAEVAIMPPPIVGDPWSSVVEATLSGGSAAAGGDDGVA